VNRIPESGITEGFDELAVSTRSFKGVSPSSTWKRIEPVISSEKLVFAIGLISGVPATPTPVPKLATIPPSSNRRLARDNHDVR
jgi:hypothetical protein